MRSRYAIACALAIAGTTWGCGSATGPQNGFVITGIIQNNSGHAIPLQTRLLVVWVVSAGSDYTYVFGEGSIDRRRNTFELVMTEPPPVDALNGGAVGVGVVVATVNQTMTTGDDISDLPSTELIGAAGPFGVIYVDDVPEATSIFEWAEGFEAGYGMGVGDEGFGAFDIFVPTDPGDVEVTIDDWADIAFVNWT